MQTDPNWGNFLYDVQTRTTYLIDFGAAREYGEEFVLGYLNIVTANANRDGRGLNPPPKTSQHITCVSSLDRYFHAETY